MSRVEKKNVEAAILQLSTLFPKANIRSDNPILEQYGHDESDTIDVAPDVVVFAEHSEHVQHVFRVAQACRVPVTPVGARTGKSGGSLPMRGGISLSTERMTKIVRIDTENLVAVAQPGVITGSFMKAVEAKGLFYPPDPNSWESCSLGGNIAENAGGPRALKYGVTRDYVLGLEWVLPSGELIRVGRETIKGVVGYDLVGLFVGSEGTLGVATEITFQLLPKPKFIATALVIFKDVIEAANGISSALAEGLLPRTLELLDDVSLRAVEGKAYNFPRGAGAAVIVEVDGNNEDALFDELLKANAHFEKHGSLESVVAQNDSQREQLWASRRMISTSLRAMKKYKISEDVCVPRSQIANAIAQFKKLGSDHQLVVATYGHAGDGNLHANVLYDDPSERPKVDAVIESMMRTTVELKGTLSGEHGIGIAKKDFVSLEQSPGALNLQKLLKSAIDPHGLCNPEKLWP